MVDIDEGDHQQRGNQDEIDQCRQSVAVLQSAGYGKEAAEHFDNRISDGYARVAAAAPPTQDKVTEQRDIVVPADDGAAGRAGRCRTDNRFPGGNAVDADIQETADAHTDKKNKPIDH